MTNHKEILRLKSLRLSTAEVDLMVAYTAADKLPF